MILRTVVILAALTASPPTVPPPDLPGDTLVTTGSVSSIRVTEWLNGSPMDYGVDNSVLLDVEIPPGFIRVRSDIPWIPYPNEVAGRLWAFWSEDGGETYKGYAWDWMGNQELTVKSFGTLPGPHIGTMVSTACGHPEVACDVQPETVRSNVIMRRNDR